MPQSAGLGKLIDWDRLPSQFGRGIELRYADGRTSLSLVCLNSESTLSGSLHPRWSDSNACLEFLFQARYRDDLCRHCGRVGRLYQLASKPCYACACGRYCVYPMKGTLFQASPLPLSKWFHAVRLMAESSGAVKATALQQALGVTYVTAWRMKHKIKSRMPRNGKPTFMRLLDFCIKVEPKSSEGSASR